MQDCHLGDYSGHYDHYDHQYRHDDDDYDYDNDDDEDDDVKEEEDNWLVVQVAVHLLGLPCPAQ